MFRNLLLASLLLGFIGASIGMGATAVPTFADRYDYQACTGGYAVVAVADINGDGIPDMVCNDVGALTTLLGNGDGTFRAGAPVNIAANFPVLLDLNGDGKIDLIASSSTRPYGFFVSLGNGDGTFQPGTFYQTGNDEYGFFVVVGDFNGDGIVDFASESSTGIWLFTGIGAGIFNPGVLTPVIGAGEILEQPLAALDVNGDGKLDIVASIGTGFTVLLGNGNGTFQPQIDTEVPFAEVSFATGDLNGDGRPDVFPVSRENSNGLLYLGNGDGTFTLARKVPLGSSPFSAAIADLNGDGFPDIVTSNGELLFGNGKGYFTAPVIYPILGSETNYVLPADLRGNGLTDLVFVNFGAVISVMLNVGNGKFQDGKSVHMSGSGPSCAVSADFNGDGTPDLAVGVTSGISILLGTGNASSPYIQGSEIALTPFSCPAEADLNGDGIPDLLITATSGTAVAYLGNGDGTFTQLAQTTPLTSNGSLALGDFNGDGKIDFALTSNLLAYGNGDGTFQTPAPYIPQVLSGSILGIAAARLNGEGVTDIVLTDPVANLVYVLLSNGKQGFTETTFSSVAASPCEGPGVPVLADVNADGHKDLLLGCNGVGVPIYLNRGGGAFQYSTTLNYAGLTDSVFPLVTDVNGDGIADIVVQGRYDLGIFVGEGSAVFAPPIYIGDSSLMGPLLAVDAHGQHAQAGRPDLITIDPGGTVNVYLNTTK
jgi:hypothetical protein